MEVMLIEPSLPGYHHSEEVGDEEIFRKWKFSGWVIKGYRFKSF